MSYNSTHTGPEIDDAISKVENGLPIQNGGTGADNAANARTNLDIYSKSEVDSEVSTAISGLASISNVNSAISTHNSSTSAHNDIRAAIDEIQPIAFTDEEITAICDFDGIPESDVIPIATKAALGCVVAGGGLDIDENGVLSLEYDVTPIKNGGTGATTVAGARNALGLGNTSGALPIANGGTGKMTALEALLALGGIQIKKLWENASPTSNVNVQVLSADTSGCTHWAVLANMLTSGNRHKLFLARTGDTIIIDFAYGNASKTTNYYRGMTYTSNSKIQIESGYASTPSSDDANQSVCIPIAIYGIKGVL